ncbi:hypothetical protein SAMN05444143_103228 [Flavobacterium succinicans]|uniref:Lipoprotein n=1 Tax=Flavobacterium succinicans TaxID=29536 RepID=A0A1I4ULP9_9FLAO|nr:hypothetical protein [Flavobacterium succinicans]SFM89902.1 hypothetical protein SAMN05444143_103228 [Flavobacterium succinicans]
MKKILFLVLCFASLSSCNLPSYVLYNPGQTTGVDFTSGKWLLNEIDAPANCTKHLKETSIRDFKILLGDRLNYVSDVSGLLLTQKKIPLQPSKQIITEIRKGTNYDFFINIKAIETRNDFGSIDWTPRKMSKEGINSNEVTIEIYDLKNSQIIYTQKVIASVGRQNDNNDVHISKTSRSLIIGAYNKLKKDIENKSIK